MNVTFDTQEMRSLVIAVVTEVLAAIDGHAADGRIAYPEKEAAALLGIAPHQLRDARLRGEITGTRLGGRIGYERNELCEYLSRQRLTRQ